MNEIIVIDDFISYSYQEQIKDLLLGINFPWYYINDITRFKTAYRGAPAMSHFFKEPDKSNSHYFSFLLPMAFTACDKLDRKFNDVLRCRSFLQIPLNRNCLQYEVDELHVDDSIEHLVLLYYVIDADGDTIIVDKKLDNVEEKNLVYSNFPIISKITPKQGRAVLFDGRYYHTAEQPKNHVRCVINFNII